MESVQQLIYVLNGAEVAGRDRCYAWFGSTPELLLLSVRSAFRLC